MAVGGREFGEEVGSGTLVMAKESGDIWAARRLLRGARDKAWTGDLEKSSMFAGLRMSEMRKMGRRATEWSL